MQVHPQAWLSSFLSWLFEILAAGSGCQDSYVLIPRIAQQLRTLTSLQPQAYHFVPAEHQVIKEAQTPQSFLPQPHTCFAEGSPVRGGLKILNRLAQVPQRAMSGCAVLRFALAAGTQIHHFFTRDTSLFLVQA